MYLWGLILFTFFSDGQHLWRSREKILTNFGSVFDLQFVRSERGDIGFPKMDNRAKLSLGEEN